MSTSTPPRPRRARSLGWIAIVAALGAVFLAYRDPVLMVDLANRIWACF